MRDVKYCLETFTLYDYRGVERHLEAMEAKGWRLEKTGNLWKYRRTEPRKVHYAVTYVPEASEFNPAPTAGQENLAELCAAAGWEKAADWFQMQIFRSEQPDPMPLETEETVRLEVLQRAIRKNFLPSSLLVTVLGVVMLAMQIRIVWRDPIDTLTRTSRLFPILLWLLVVFSAGGNLLDYALWLRRSKKSVAQGGPCAPGGGYRWLAKVSWAVLGVLLVGYAASMLGESSPQMLAFVGVYFALTLLLIALVRGTQKGLRRVGASKHLNMGLTLAVDVVGALVLIGGLMAVVTLGIFRYHWFQRTPVDTYDTGNYVFHIYHDKLPLTIEDLTGETYSGYSYEREERASFLLGYLEGRQWHVPDGTQSLELDYEILDVKAEFLYDWCLEQYLEEYADDQEREYRPEDPSPWGAEAAYRLWWDEEAYHRWILCFDGRIVKLNPDWTLTPEQMALAGERLSG